MAFIQQDQQSVIDVSVIIPVYNAAETIERLASKILSENNVVIELIIVNDGSRDGTGSIVQGICDDRVILVEQENCGVYAARNAAIAIHRGEWVIFLDADDDVKDGFIYTRWQMAKKAQADVVICNAWSTCTGTTKTAAHAQQPYKQCLSGQDWIRHCVTRREWPHYLWLQLIRSSYIRQHALSFQSGKSHKDILWTINLALENGRFYFSDIKDYTYIYNTESITHRGDYYDIRAASYVEVIAEIIRLAGQPKNQDIRLPLLRHALVETRHFLGLYRNNVQDKSALKTNFRANIAFKNLFRGISSFSDAFFFIKLVSKLL